jgi:esterase/lipase
MGVESLAGVSAPLMVMVGNADEVAPAERNGIVAYDDASSPIKSLVLLDGAGHDLALDIANPNQRQLVNHFATAFFLAHLAQDAGATAALEADATNVDGVEYTTTP